MKSAAHTFHTMKHVYSRVEEVSVRSYSMAKRQKRIVMQYQCDCFEIDVLYRELDKSEFDVKEYRKEISN